MKSIENKILYDAGCRLQDLLRGKHAEKIDISDYTDESARQFAVLTNQLIECFSEIREFIIPLSQGKLNRSVPRTANVLASPFKELHARLLHLTWQAERIAEGDYHQRIDFMGSFSAAFNSMVEKLADREESLERAKEQLEEKVCERTAELTTINEQIRRDSQLQTVINELLSLSLRNLSLEEILEQAFDLIVNTPYLQLQSKGGIFLVEDDAEVLVMKVHRALPEQVKVMCSQVPFGTCLCGMAASTRQVQFAECVDDRHERKYDGISEHGHYCVPIIFSQEVLGVITLYLEAGHIHSSIHEQFLQTVADVLSGIILRKKAEENLMRQKENLYAIFDAAPIGMLLLDENASVKQANNIGVKLTCKDSSEIINVQIGNVLSCIHASKYPKRCGRSPVCYTCPIHNTIEDVLRSGQAVHGVEVQPTLLVGGNKVCPWLVISAEPLVIDGSKHIIVAIDDITERKQAEAELETAQKVLIDTAHRAGMAEVAADILHNVGNVLNSINVSTNVIREKVTHSELANLEKVASIINEHADDLGTFLTEHPQGKHIPVYLTEVSKCLQNEQTDIISRLWVLADNVQHIRDIVSMQQEYAKISGVKFQMSLSTLAEDAIQINSAGLERHGVRLIREFDELGDVEIDKQRVLQILVNLISNAKYALSDSSKEEKLLTIRIYKHCEDCFQIEVADNGVGISEDNLTRIFSHGFTTKEHGHGFGLHSSALAAKEMGGSLTVYSKGVGQGATFTLELPFKPVEVIK